MNNRFRTLAVVMGLLSFLAAGTESMAGQRSINRTGPYGNTYSRNIATTRTGNGYTRTGTVTGPQGNTATRTAQGQWDPTTQTWTKNVTATGANGQTAARSTTVSKTDNGYNSSTTVTGPQGNSATRSASGQWDPVTKTWTKNVTTSGTGQ